VDRVHGTSLNVSRLSDALRLGLNELKGYSALLILVVDVGMDDPRQLSRQGRRARPTAAAHRSRPLPVFQSTKHNKVFTYGIRATQGRTLLLSSGQRAVAPRVLWATKLASDGGDCSPNSWHPSIVARIGGRRHAMMVARVLGLGVLRVKIRGCYL
jgi:hypothetical protein